MLSDYNMPFVFIFFFCSIILVQLTFYLVYVFFNLNSTPLLLSLHFYKMEISAAASIHRKCKPQD